MIAYKVFYKDSNGDLHPTTLHISNRLMPYDPNFIIQRPDGCGPFGCFKNKQIALAWACKPEEVCHRVKIKPSKDLRFWFGTERFDWRPSNTFFADEFEILERVT